MERVYQEFHNVKMDVEKLKDECWIKTELSESLRKAFDERLSKLEEAKLKMEKLVQQLINTKYEINEVKQLCQELKSSLHGRDLLVKHLYSSYETTQVNSEKKVQKLEEDKKNFALNLKEPTRRIQVLQSTVCASDQEIEGLKKHLTVEQEMSFEAEQKILLSRELQQRDELIGKVKVDIRSSEDKLRWKIEEFKHLKQALRLLQDQVRSTKSESERDRSTLLEEVSSLKVRLDSQTQISENLQTQLRLCNQALVREENRRKASQLELSESKSRSENVLSECEDVISKIQELTLDRDEEIQKLRSSLRTKEIILKEMGNRTTFLEQENQELRASFKEFQEDQNRNAVLLNELRNQHKDLEQFHRICPINISEKEVELFSHINKLTEDKGSYLSELNSRSRQIQRLLQEQLESCHWLMEEHLEENAIPKAVSESFFAVYSNLFSEKAKLDMSNKEIEETIMALAEQIEAKNSTQTAHHADTQLECNETKSSNLKFKPFEVVQKENHLSNIQVGRVREKQLKLHECQLHLTMQVMQINNALQEVMEDLSDALEKANSELLKPVGTGETELKLRIWKCAVEVLKGQLEETRDAYEQDKRTFLDMLKTKEEEISTLQQQIVLLELNTPTNADEMKTVRQEKEESNTRVENLMSEVSSLKEESAKREREEAMALAHLDAQKAFEKEREGLFIEINEKDRIILGPSSQVKTMEQSLANLIISSVEQQVEIDVLRDALEKDKEQKNLVIVNKNDIIAVLQKNLSDLHERLKLQNVLHSNEEAEQLKTLLQTTMANIEELKVQFGTERGQLEGQIKKLELQNRDVLDSITKLSADRDNLLSQIKETSKNMSKFSARDSELMGMMEAILRRVEKLDDGCLFSGNTDIKKLNFYSLKDIHN